jgi:hypothetical protein
VLPGTQTVMVTKGTFAEMKLPGSGPASTTMGATLGPAAVGLTVTEAVPDLVESWLEVAVTVSTRLAVTTGAVSRPELEIEPAVALHVTDELKFPVPFTVAEHWLVWPDVTVDGEQLTLTEVIELEVLFPPPPQAASSDKLPSTRHSPSFCTVVSPSVDLACLHALRH